jgi:hypothetical protein
MRRIDVLMAYAESDREGQALVAAFREGLQKLGGRRAAIFGSTLAGRADVELMQRFAREIVELQLADKQLGVVFMTTLKLKTLFLILPALFFLSPICAAEFTYKEYTKASESWRRGFVFGISRYMSTVAQPDEEAPYPVRTAFQRCLGGSTDTLLARHVEAYAASNPGSSNGSMVAVVMRALFDLCRSEIEKTKPANTAPGQRSRP